MGHYGLDVSEWGAGGEVNSKYSPTQRWCLDGTIGGLNVVAMGRYGVGGHGDKESA